MSTQRLTNYFLCVFTLSLLLISSTVYSQTLVDAPTAHYSFSHVRGQEFNLSDENGNSILLMSSFSSKPNWQWIGSKHLNADEYDPSKQKKKARNSISASTLPSYSYQYDIHKGSVDWRINIRADAKTNQINISNALEANVTLPLTYISQTLTPSTRLKGGRAIATDMRQQTTVMPFPLKIYNLTDITRLELQDNTHNTLVTLHFPELIDIHAHGQIRLKIAEDKVVEGQKIQNNFSLSTNKPVKIYSSSKKIPNRTDHSEWFPFVAKKISTSGAIGMKDWLSIPDTPLSIKGKQLFKDNAPHTIWGTNLNYSLNAPKRKQAIQRAKFYAKYGINSVRLHKLSNPGWEGIGSNTNTTEYDPQKLARFDFWTYQLRKRGISYGLSPIWDLYIVKEDKRRLLAFDEIAKVKPTKPVTTGLVWFAEDIQALHIETLTNLLTHKNPHSKLSYSQDPAVAFIEIQNEENSFFYTFLKNVQKYPTYYKLLAEQFSDWLLAKYKTEDKLIDSWGRSAFNTFGYEGGMPNEQLSQRNIVPVLNPWLYDNHASSGRRAQRLQDSAEFLFEKQQDYYQKASNAIRATGYKGPIINSNWQAGSKGAHFLNLFSDANAGIVDRHNYQGGAINHPKHQMKTGFSYNNYTMLGDPGGGLLSMGMQQVSNRPFGSSEWLVNLPSEWAAADTTIMAAYGFGLQGWDMSYHFASDNLGFGATLGAPGEGKFSTTTPVGIGLYPILSRMVLRGDVTEAEPLAIRRLSKQQAIENSYDFSNEVIQSNDIKSLSGTPHHSALAAGKVLVEWTQEDGQSDLPNWKSSYLTNNDDGSQSITSSTQQLKWTFWKNKKKGYVEINTKGTQGSVGFSPNKVLHFDDLSIESHSPFAVILATAKSPDKQLSNDKEILIAAVARAHNTDMNLTNDLIVNLGTSPVIVEPVKATIRFKRKQGKVDVLDNNGITTGKSYPLIDGKFSLNTGRDKTLYYRVRFQ